MSKRSDDFDASDNVELAAHQLYNVYGDHASWKNFQGSWMPAWAELPMAIREHWRAVATRAIELGYKPDIVRKK